MNEMLQQINSIGKAFVQFAGPMLIQSGVLVLILLLADLLLRKKVRAVFRYWMWMLVLVKLLLPASLSLPMSFGYWFGDKLGFVEKGPLDFRYSIPDSGLPFEHRASGIERAGPIEPAPMPRPELAPAEPIPTEPVSSSAVSGTPLSWQGALFLVWLAVVAAMSLLLLQRAIFVRGLIAQAEESTGSLIEALQYCCQQIAVKRKVSLKISPNASSPAVCGLFRPVILMPQKLASNLGSDRLQVVLMHELAHIKRGDLWVNLAQTVLQIVYFYNPLLWLANAIIRRVREQAVDEAVLVAMGEAAQQYPQALLDVAKLAFRRPTLSLRLIGVVESKSALASRIKHILNRPMPKTAKLGILGLLAIIVTAVILLPMAKPAGESEASRFSVAGKPLDIRLIGVRPDAGDEVYDPQGNRLSWSPGVLDVTDRPWGKQNFRRDFIFKVPDIDGEILFDTWQNVSPVGVNWKLKLGGVRPLCRSNGRQLFLFSTHIPRKHPKRIARLFSLDVPTRKVNLTLRYYYGPPRDPICTFAGPFSSGEKVRADGNSAYELTPEKLFSNSLTYRFRVSDNLKLSRRSTVLIYQNTGKKHLVTEVTREFFVFDSLSLEEIASVTIGEKPHERTFRNIVVSYPDRPATQYPPYLDRVAQQLGLTDLSKDDLATYRFKNANQAIAVIDIIQGGELARSAVQAITYSKPKTEIGELDEHTQEKMRATAARWAASVDLQMRFYGLQLGLLASWPEFLEQAINMLRENYEYLPSQDLRAVQGNLGHVVWLLLNRWRDRLTPEQLESLRAYYNGQRKLPILSSPKKVSPAIKPREELVPHRQQPFSATLPNGVTVELVGLCEHPSEGKQWWGLDGRSIAKPYDRLNYTEHSQDSGLYEIAYRLFGTEDIAFTIYSNDAVIGYAGHYPLSQKAQKLNIQDGDNVDGAILFVRPDAQSIVLEIGAGREAYWQTVCTQGSPVDKTGTAGPGVVFQPAIEKDGKTYVTIAHQTKDKQIQVVAIDHSGQLHKPEGISNTTSNELGSCQVRFDLPADQIKEIQFQTQKFQRIAFKNVSLKPGVKTNVQIEVEKPAVQVEADKGGEMRSNTDAHISLISADEGEDQMNYRWGITRSSPLKVIEGWYEFDGAGIRSHGGGGRKITETRPMQLTLRVSKENGFLLLHRSYARSSAAADQQADIAAKIEWPASAALRTYYLSEPAGLTDKIQPVWKAELIQDATVTKSVVYAVRVVGENVSDELFDASDTSEALRIGRAWAPRPDPGKKRYEGRTIEQWIAQWDSRSYDDVRVAIEALTRIGRPAVPAMIELMKKGGNRATHARTVLGNMGPQAEEALDWLIETALDKNLPAAQSDSRINAVICLSYMTWAADRLVPVFTTIAEDRQADIAVRRVAISGLQKIGGEAMPILQKIADSEQGEIRDYARSALSERLAKQGLLSRQDYYTQLIEKDPFDPSVPQYLTSTKGIVNYGRPHALTNKVKAMYRQRLQENPDPELAWRLAAIIQNGLRATELEWAAPADSSSSKWNREDPAESFATLAEVLELGFSHAEPRSELWLDFGISLAKLRLLQGNWDEMNATVKKVGQEPIPEESRQWLPAPPVDWSVGLCSQWQIADESMRSGNCGLEFRFEKDGKGLKGAHVLVKRAPEPTNVFRSGIAADTLFYAPHPIESYRDSFGYRGNDREETRYAVSGDSGIVRFDRLPDIPIKIEALVPTSNFAEAASTWDLWMEVEPGEFKIAKLYGGADAVNPRTAPAVVTLKQGQTVRYPKLVVRPAFGLNVSDWDRADKDNIVLSWHGIEPATQTKNIHYELQMSLSAPGETPDLVEHAPVVESARQITETTSWPVSEKGVGSLFLQPGNIYMFEVRAVDESGTVVARWPRTRIWTPWNHRRSNPPFTGHDSYNSPPIHDEVWFRGEFNYGDGRKETLQEKVARFLRESPDAFEHEYVRIGKAWLDWHDGDSQSARRQLQELVRELPRGNVVRGTAVWLLQQMDDNKEPPRRLKFVPDRETASRKAASLPDVKTDVQVEGEEDYSGVAEEPLLEPSGRSFSKDSKSIPVIKPHITIEHKNRVDTVLFSPDGASLISESFSDGIKICETLTGGLLRALPLRGYSANSIALSHDGAVLAMGTNTGKIHLWNMQTLRLEKAFPVTKWSIYAIALSPDHEMLASCAADGTVQLWDIENSRQLETLGKKGAYRMSSMSFSPDSNVLATLTRDGRADMWDVLNGKLIGTLATEADSWGSCSITFCPDGNTVAIATPGLVQLWNPENNNQVRTINLPDSINPWKILDDREPMSRPVFVGMIVLSPDCKKAASVIKDGAIVIWDVLNRTVEQKLIGSRIPDLPGGGIRTMGFSPDKKLFASGNENGKVELWKLADMNK